MAATSQSQPSDFSYTPLLQDLMQQVGFSSFRALSQVAGVSRWQVDQLRRGQAHTLRVATLLKISQALQVSLEELVTTFTTQPQSAPGTIASTPTTANVQEAASEIAALRQEYQRLQNQLQQQQETLQQQFQQETLRRLESWMLFWPTAAHKAQQEPDLPASRLLPLVRPVEQLLLQWGVEAIASVGAEIPYDPQLHQLTEGTAQPGDRVRVRNVGYRQGEKLLHRAKVSPV